MNSALQRARATLGASADRRRGPPSSTTTDRALLARYVDAFERYDMDALTVADPGGRDAVDAAVRAVARGRDDILTWWSGPGIGCQGSRLLPNGGERLARVRAVQAEPGRRLRPVGAPGRRAHGGRIGEFTFFLDTETLFPLFGLPSRLEA